MAEIILDPEQPQEAQIQALLAAAGDRATEVTWAPRPNTAFGGVYIVPDDLAKSYTQQATTARGRRKAVAPNTQAIIKGLVEEGDPGTVVGTGDPNDAAQGGGGSAVPSTEGTPPQGGEQTPQSAADGEGVTQ